jgi:hypothetical protein
MRFVCDDLVSGGLQDLPRRRGPGWQAPPPQVICYTRLFGAVPKWPKGEVCKTSIRGFESHPRLQDSKPFSPPWIDFLGGLCSGKCSGVLRVALEQPIRNFPRQYCVHRKIS